jgi:hypothetical protein
MRTADGRIAILDYGLMTEVRIAVVVLHSRRRPNTWPPAWHIDANTSQ